MREQEILNLIQLLGFQQESSRDIFVREYKEHGCAISVDFQKKKILYPQSIQIGDETSTHFSHPENFVVLECVDRLLKKGYRPEDLHLEKKWALGRTQKGGKADITIKGSDGNTILIIECKTWGQEYEKGKTRMQANGGQLFSYLQQDRNTKYLCLYSSAVLNNSIKYENAICKVVDESKESNDVVDFQWKEGIDNYEDLQDRLQKLYQVGMREYLKEEIIYFENDYVEKAFRYHKKAIAKDKMTAMLKALKFYTNNEFAFKEVHNEKLFKQKQAVRRPGTSQDTA